MSGLEFAQAVNEFLSTHGGQTRRIGVIRANPNKSKHLETAAAKIMDLEIDFVNLRNETYTDDSRIPEMVSPLFVEKNEYYEWLKRMERNIGLDCLLIDSKKKFQMKGFWHSRRRRIS